MVDKRTEPARAAIRRKMAAGFEATCDGIEEMCKRAELAAKAFYNFPTHKAVQQWGPAVLVMLVVWTLGYHDSCCNLA